MNSTRNEAGRSMLAGAPGAAPQISARALVKRYGELVAVDGIDLEAYSGTCLGLLGPNGAGKTTTIEILEGILDADDGDVNILGLDWRRNGPEIRSRIGVQLQETRLADKLTVREQLRVFRSFYRDGRTIDEVLELVGLREKGDARTEKLSGGQKQRLALGCALVNHPDVLFLDEPTTGLDPQARRRVWEIVEDFKRGGGTVLLTTHYMDEAERLSDELIIIDRGKIIAAGSPETIISALGTEAIVSFSVEQKGAADSAPPASLLADLEALNGVQTVRREGGVTSLSVVETHRTLPRLLDRIRQEGLVLADLHTHRTTLEDVFVAMTGRHLRDE